MVLKNAVSFKFLMQLTFVHFYLFLLLNASPRLSHVDVESAVQNTLALPRTPHIAANFTIHYIVAQLTVSPPNLVCACIQTLPNPAADFLGMFFT